MVRILAILFFVFIAALERPALCQCSDAGICSLENHTDRLRPLFLSLTYDYGYGGKQDNIFINDLKLAINYQVTSRLGISAILPFTKKVLNNTNYSGSVEGIGDIIINATFEIFSKDPEITGDLYEPRETCFNDANLTRLPKTYLLLDIGSKLATGNIIKNQLPLRYQTGLGSNDLLLGISYIPGPKTAGGGGTDSPQYWKFRFGFQIPFGITSNSIDSIRRGPDLVGRVTYFNAIPNFDYQLELFAIKRLTKTKKYFQGPLLVTNENSPDVIDTLYGNYEIPKSDFFQINLRLFAKYYFATDAGVLIGAAIPFLRRGENIDGLERSYTIFCGISYLFGRHQ